MFINGTDWIVRKTNKNLPDLPYEELREYINKIIVYSQIPGCEPNYETLPAFKQVEIVLNNSTWKNHCLVKAGNKSAIIYVSYNKSPQVRLSCLVHQLVHALFPVSPRAWSVYRNQITECRPYEIYANKIADKIASLKFR